MCVRVCVWGMEQCVQTGCVGSASLDVPQTDRQEVNLTVREPVCSTEGDSANSKHLDALRNQPPSALLL